MGKETVVIKFHYFNKEVDLDVPVTISAQEFIISVNEAYQLGIDITDIKNCYLQAENPITLLKGNKTLSEFGLHNGTDVYLVK